jgi:hypothetical protein
MPSGDGGVAGAVPEVQRDIAEHGLAVGVTVSAMSSPPSMTPTLRRVIEAITMTRGHTLTLHR